MYKAYISYTQTYQQQDFGPSNELSTGFILSQAFLVRREGRQGPLGEKVLNLAF